MNRMNRIAAGITLYEPEPQRLTENIAAALCQTERVYLVDNASTNLATLKRQWADEPRITLIENPDNAGIAKALNQMCEAALGDGFDWILTLDQDSLPERDLIEKYSRYLDIPQVALITPRVTDDNEPADTTVSSDQPYDFIERCNTSASLTRLSVFREIGGFDEKMFIDCVDFDYCTTLTEHGYRILRDNSAVLHHRLGQAKRVDFFVPIGRFLHIKKLQQPLFTYNHSPLRTYYYARNIRYYRAKHAGSVDRRTERRTQLKWVVLKLLFEKQRFKKLCAMLRGRRDAKKMIRALNAENS